MTLAPVAVEAGRDALARIDRVLAERPRKDDDALSAAVRALCLLREGLIAEAGGGDAARDRLEALNAVLGVVLGAHFPIGPTPWDDLETARGWLAEVVDAVGSPG